jgi:hypothetical protein
MWNTNVIVIPAMEDLRKLLHHHPLVSWNLDFCTPCRVQAISTWADLTADLRLLLMIVSKFAFYNCRAHDDYGNLLPNRDQTVYPNSFTASNRIMKLGMYIVIFQKSPFL